MAQSTGRIWQRSKLSFQLIPEDQINSNLCLNTANTSHGQQPPSPAPGSRKALCVISLKGRWGWGVYSAIPHYKFYCDCATAGNTTEPVEYFKTHYKWQNKHNFFFYWIRMKLDEYFSCLHRPKPQRYALKLLGLSLRLYSISSSEELQRIHIDLISWYMGLLVKTSLSSQER